MVAVDWVSPSDFPATEPDLDLTLADLAASHPPPGRERFLVFFVQTDFHGVRRHGHRNVLGHVRRLPWSLHPGDWAAVVAFGSHLELWQDFTRERTPVEEALSRSITFGSERGRNRPRRAASPEKGLEVTARR